MFKILSKLFGNAGENVAEKILSQEKSVGVTDENNKIVGTVHPSKIINTVFGGKKNND